MDSKTDKANIKALQTDKLADPAGLAALDVAKILTNLQPPAPPRNIRDAIDRRHEFEEYERRKAEAEALINQVYADASQARKKKIRALDQEEQDRQKEGKTLFSLIKRMGRVLFSALRAVATWITRILMSFARIVINVLIRMAMTALAHPLVAGAVLVALAASFGVWYAYSRSKESKEVIDVGIKSVDKPKLGEAPTRREKPTTAEPVSKAPTIERPQPMPDVRSGGVREFFTLDQYKVAGQPPYGEMLPEHKTAASDLLDRINALLSLAKSAGIRFREDQLNSGYRSKEKTEQLRRQGVNASRTSKHMTGQAADIGDPLGELDKFLMSNIQLLDKYDVSIEDPRMTKGWAHIQTGKSRGSRVFAMRINKRSNDYDQKMNEGMNLQLASGDRQQPVDKKGYVQTKRGLARA